MSQSSWLLTEKCERCGCDYPADCAGLCDNCSDRITVEVSAFSGPVDEIEWLSDEDVIEDEAA